MKASVFTWEYPPAIYGGAGVHAKYITTALAKRIKVEVRTLEVGPKPEIKGVNVLRYQSTLRGLATGDPRILKALQVLSFNMNMVADPIDAAIVHTHTWYTNFAGAMAKRIYGAKLVATVHSLEPLRPWKREQLGAGYELSLWMERDGLLACDAVIAVSRDMKADIQKAYPIPASRVAVIHNGIIENFHELRERLELQGHDLGSDTDTEVVAHLVEDAMRGGADLPAAVRAAVAELEGAEYVKASDEHGVLKLNGSVRLAVGEKLKLIPGHCDPTVNLYDQYVCVRNGRVEAIWPITARGAVW